MSLKEDYRDDIEKSPKDLEKEIDETRMRMEHTLDLLERKLSPSDMFEEAFRIVRRNGGEFASNLSTEVQNKPLPALLAGVGLAWLMTASDRPPQYRGGSGFGSRFGQRAREGAHNASEGAHQMGDRAREMGDHLQDRAHDMGERFQDMGRRAGDAASRAGDAAARAGEGMHERADRLRHAAQRGGQRAKEEYQHLLQEQPLLLGGLGLALGAALGAMVPRTEAEDHLMGEHSDRAKEEVKDQAQRASKEARESAERVAGAAQEQMSKERQDKSREHQQHGQSGQPYQGPGDQSRSSEHDGGSRHRPS